MATTAKKHYYYAHQHSLAAQGLPSIHNHSILTQKQHYNLAREHRRAAKGQPYDLEKIVKLENVIEVDKVTPVKASCSRDAPCLDMLEGVRRTLSRGRTARPIVMAIAKERELA